MYMPSQHYAWAMNVNQHYSSPTIRKAPGTFLRRRHLPSISKLWPDTSQTVTYTNKKSLKISVGHTHGLCRIFNAYTEQVFWRCLMWILARRQIILINVLLLSFSVLPGKCWATTKSQPHPIQFIIHYHPIILCYTIWGNIIKLTV
jgi:hypothetical protein